jgi:glycosyltransferase involved in cell wall biosynthesis
MATINVDTTYLIGKNGIARDARQVLERLQLKNDVSEIRFLNFTLNKNRMLRRILNILNLTFRLHIPISKRYDGVFFQPHISVFTPGKNSTGWVIRLHDLFPITNPEWFRWWAGTIFKRNLEFAVKNGAFFLFSSKYSQSIFLGKYPQCADRVAFFPCVATKLMDDLCQTCEGCLEIFQHSNLEKTLLAVGTVEPRKNYELLTSLWRLHGSTIPGINQMVIIGTPGWKSKGIQIELSQLASQNLKWIKSCCDGALGYFYENSKCFVSTSMNEGFNLPALEARTIYGLPLLLSNIQVHHEVHADKARYFNNSAELYELLLSSIEKPTGSIQRVIDSETSILNNLFNRFN